MPVLWRTCTRPTAWRGPPEQGGPSRCAPRGLGHVDGQTEALLHITHARAYAAVGAKPAAARALLAAEDALLRDDGPQRVHALTYADLGDSLAAQARADEAVAAWSQALTLMEGMTSDRTRKAITSLRSTLSIYQRRKVPGAAELARRAGEALA